MAQWQGFYDELATSRYPALLAYASALTGQRATGEDLVHDALVRTFSKPRRLQSADHAERYVRRAIVTLFIDRGRRYGRLLAVAGVIAESGAQDEATSDVDTTDEVSRALMTLAPKVRAVLVLRFYDDLTLQQISRELGIALGTTKRYLSDGLDALQPHFPRPSRASQPSRRIAVTATPRKATS